MVAGGLGSADGYGGYRARLVETLRDRGISDMRVLAAVASVPRHLFVPEAVRHRAYEDTALPIGGGQTISQPYIQALYLQTLGLTGKERVLEIGTGSGYQTALLAQMTEAVVSVERLAALADGARAVLRELGVRNITIVVGDGTLGWRALAPYDGILVAAGGPKVPEPLVEQLAAGGRLIVPVGDREHQTLMLVVREPGGPRITPVAGARFVPLIGEFGHPN